jgi:hypothetical protein
LVLAPVGRGGAMLCVMREAGSLLCHFGPEQSAD